MLKRFSTIVAALAAKSRPNAGRTLPWLWVMTDVDRLPDPAAIIARLPLFSAVVIRHIDHGKRRSLVEHALPFCKARRLKLLVSQDWRTAAAVRADGVHIPENDISTLPAGLRLWRRAKGVLVTAAAHNARAIRMARQNKCDAVFVAPVLPTRSHPAKKALGRARYALMARQAKIPVMALGGITPGTVRNLNGTRTSGVAGIGFAEKG